MKSKPNRLTLEEAAAWLDMKVRTLRDRIQNGEIKYIRDGKRILIAEEEVEDYDKRRQIAAIA